MNPTAVSLKFVSCGTPDQGCIALLTLNREESGNAFDGVMVNELSGCLEFVAKEPGCRLLVLQGKGRNFCTGARLDWMEELGKLPYEENLAAAETMATMFRRLAELPCPSIGIARGSVYGGGVGLLACCDIAIASDESRFCLSEVKIGLLPAVILPYLQRKLAGGQLRRLTLSGSVFTAAQALSYGLLEESCPAENLHTRVEVHINQFLAAAPEAQRQLKQLLHLAHAQSPDHLCRAIATARSGKEGQAGLDAYRHKHAAPWVTRLTPDWNT
jgi:methylglutaconyl-CoA hydratase